MRKLLGSRRLFESIRREYIYTSYLVNKTLTGLMVFAVLYSILLALTVIFATPSAQFSGSAPWALAVFATFLYQFAVAIYASSIADDIEKGEAITFLAHTLTKQDYVFSWIIATCFLPATVSLIAPVVTIAVADPKIFSLVDADIPLYMFLQILETGSIATLLAVATRSKAVSQAVSIAIILLSTIVCSIIRFIFPDVAVVIMALFGPLYYRLAYGDSHPYIPPRQHIFISVPTATAIAASLTCLCIALSILLFRRSDV